MQPPKISDYQSAAKQIYEPQKKAESGALKTTYQTTVNSLESEKGQVGTDYQSAIDKLTQAVKDQSAQISQLYTERLGGNFSGLQGNDMGAMFARTNEAQSIIEQTRANKLSQISTGETNAKITYQSGVAALAPKYQSLETQYAQSAYGSAVKNYQDYIYKQSQLQLAQERLAVEEQNAANSSSLARERLSFDEGKYANSLSANAGKGYKLSQKDNNAGYSFAGPNGQPVSMYQFAAATGSSMLDLLKNSQSKYDKNAYTYASELARTGHNEKQILGALKANFGKLF